MSGPLHGIRIVDLTSVVSGPSATMLLADQGADVIKVESLEGDFTRHVSNRRGGMAANYLNNNRNKRSVALDLKDPRGKAVLMRLLHGADVFAQNFRPGVIERMRLDEATVRSAAPDIVYVSISGFGERGPYAAKPVYDPLVQALSGLTTIQAGSDGERPRLVRTILPDKLTGITAAQAITAALVARLRTGKGQHVRLSMLESVIAFLWHSDMGSQTFVDGNVPQQDAQSFIDLIYETADSYITVALMTDRQWRAAAEAMERPDWLTDPRFSTAARRQENIDARLALTQEVLRTRKTRGMARAAGGGRRALCPRADPQRHDPPSADRRERHCYRVRARARRTAPPGAAGGNVLRDPGRPLCRRAGARFQYRRSAGRGGIRRRRDRRSGGCGGHRPRYWRCRMIDFYCWQTLNS
jgi:crotonobetainyl-CoA:carnitine CoA-transferase CaiB-like acyl-CoA transferase